MAVAGQGRSARPESHTVNTGPSGWYRRLAQPRLGYALLVLHTLRSESNNPMESEMPPNRQVFRTVKVGRIDHLYRVVHSVCVDWPQAPLLRSQMRCYYA
jgi:hypothetical protein